MMLKGVRAAPGAFLFLKKRHNETNVGDRVVVNFHASGNPFFEED